MLSKKEPLEVFISYCHLDENYKNELDRHLITLKKNKRIKTWNDRELLPGDELDKEIIKKLSSSNIIILLISVNYINSWYCFERELKKALRKRNIGEAKVISVIVSSCDWKDTIISKYLVLPTDGKPIDTSENINKTYMEVVNQIKRVINEYDSPKIEKSTRKVRRLSVSLELPYKAIVEIDESFLYEVKQQVNNLFNLDSIMENWIEDIYKDYSEGKWELKGNDLVEWDYIYMEMFFKMLCEYICIYLFNKLGVRIHMRFLDRDKYYKKLIASYEGDEYKNKMKPIYYNKGMIYQASKVKKSLIKSLNPQYHEKGQHDDRWKDYITLVFKDYFKDNNPFLTMGISFENPENHKNSMYVLNHLEFENIIQKYMNNFSRRTSIDIIDTVKKYKYNINKEEVIMA